MAVDSYEIKDKNVSDDKAIYKLRPKIVFTKDLKGIAVETKCNMDPVAVCSIEESYDVVENGKVANKMTPARILERRTDNG